MKAPLSLLRQKFRPDNAPVDGGTMNRVFSRLLSFLTFNDTPTVKWDVSETGGIRAHVKNTAHMPLNGETLQFKISVTETEIKAAAGVIDGDVYSELVEEDPADGTWYLECSATINATTGAITATGVEWVQSISADTATQRFAIIGEVEVISGVPDGVPDGFGSSIINYTYGPMLVLQVGGVDQKWTVNIF